MLSDPLISDLYAAAAGRLDWQQPLSSLAAQLDLWAVQVIGVDKRSGALIFSGEGGPATPQAALDYIRFFHSINPRMAPTLATPVGRWMHCHEHFDARYVAASPFYQDFLIPHGGRYLSATKILDSDDALYLLGIMRGHGSAPIGPADLPVIDQVRHHLGEALRNVQHIRAAFVELGVARHLLDQFAHPMLLVDEARRIRHVNPLAQAWLNSQDVVSERYGFLHCHHPENQERLARGIDAMQLGGNGGEARREAVVLRRRDGARILAFVTRMDATQTMGMFGQQSCALILLHAPQASKAPLDAFIVAECFGLTPAEAKVAVQIASGFALKEIAQRSRIALPTVRSHLQRAMEKTGTTRQAELVSALLTLPLARSAPVSR